MRPVRALKVVFSLAALGTAFSGVLAYQELFGQSAMACPAPGAPGTILGYPACVYGFFMFALITVIAAVGLREEQRPIATVGAVG
jgi:uncharacterized membrane protein